ncbi:bifunctional diaminohydroxyphosphoribosylaminopyrimidine deaminase/5-amino-6-(5-phosphoribosylamino)uracil reductase RibD [Micrococcoides hystricis]|uniref:Riboflavin biosynthesis protein RibD n=1 Tax=Micrococcoides hystricis TaxID=1572761 RepID=A0ABV6P7X4_9MICC
MGQPLPATVIDNALNYAVALAKQGTRGANPLVGAVILDADASTVATGYHRGAGTPHAEVEALNALATKFPDNDRPNPAELTMVVTLEPCNHVGRTGPCSQAIIDAGIGTVIYAVIDPDPAAAGGADTLRAAGVTVHHHSTHAGANALNERWSAAKRNHRPFVSVKIAQSLDGKIAAADGSSQWITGDRSRDHAHHVRSIVDAIVVGTGTVLADDPALSARLRTRGNYTLGGEQNTHVLADQQPLRVIMGERPIETTAKIFTEPGGETLQLNTREPRTVLTALADRGVEHVLIEGGAHITSAFLAEGLADEIYLYQAPLLIGSGTDQAAHNSIRSLNNQSLQQAWDTQAYQIEDAQPLGPDILIRLVPKPPATPKN